MKVLVTGASSLIGRRLAVALVARGDTVIGFQRTASTTAVDGVTELLGDVRDLDGVIRASWGCDAVVHLAARVGVVGSWEEFRSTNVDGTAHVLMAARSVGIGRVVHVSSPSVAHGGEPIVGDGAEPPLLGRRNAYYAESKAIAENSALAAASSEFGVVVVRPHLVWGPGDTQLVGRIVDRARRGRLAIVGGGRALVDTTYIDNAASALVAAVDAVEPGAMCSGRSYVIANGEPRPIRELLSGICAAAGVEFTPRDMPLRIALPLGSVIERVWPMLDRLDDPPITRFLAEQLGTAHWFDPRPAALDLGWTPTVTIDEGLARLAAWYADNPLR